MLDPRGKPHTQCTRRHLVTVVLLAMVAGCGGEDATQPESQTTQPQQSSAPAGAQSDVNSAQRFARGVQKLAVRQATEDQARQRAEEESELQPIEISLPSADAVYPDPALELSATEYHEDSDSLKRQDWYKKYNGKTVEIRGNIYTYRSTDQAYNSGLVMLLRADPESEFEPVEVELHQDYPWVQYPPGGTVTVRGKAEPSDEISEGLVVAYEPADPLPEFTAQEFSRRAAEDSRGLAVELVDRLLLMKGTVTRFDDQFDENGIIYLGAEGKDLVALWTLRSESATSSNYEHRRMRHWKPGDEVVLIGSYLFRSSLYRDSEFPVIDEILPVSPLPDDPALPKKRVLEDDVFLVFSADLFAEWALKNPRKLNWLKDYHFPADRLSALTISSSMEVTGEVVSAKPNENEERDLDVLLKNSSGVTIRCVHQRVAGPIPDIKPGMSVTARGALLLDLDKNEAEISGVVRPN